MLDYVYGHDEIVAQFVAQLIPSCRERGFSKCKAMGVIEDGRLIAGIVYHNFEPETQIIEMSGAALPGSHWLSRETLKRMYGYPFLQLGCQMVIMRVAADDKGLLGILMAYGYDFVLVPRMLGRNKDGMLCLLTFEAWIGNKFNRRLRHHIDTELAEAAE